MLEQLGQGDDANLNQFRFVNHESFPCGIVQGSL
jgi:hypothetical protein